MDALIPRRTWRNFDFVLLGATVLLMLYGVAMIYSAIADSPGLRELPQQQALYAVAGLVCMLVVAVVDYRTLMPFRHVLYVISLALLAVVLLFGSEAGGATRWVDLKIIKVQPSEVAKLFLVITLAGYFARQQEHIKRFRVYLVSLLYVVPPMVLIFLEPSLSAALTMGVLWVSMAFVAGVPWRYMIGTLVVILLLSPLAWTIMAPYQRDRVTEFIQPAGASSEYSNIDQALISIGSGGFFGKGFALGSQSQLRFLRVRWSDFIFSVIGEELGMAGVLVLFLLILTVILRLYRDAGLARDTFGQLIAAGMGTLILLQAVINIGMNLGMMPATGIPLPFVSAGGSSLISFLAAEGLVQSISMRRQKIDFTRASRV